MAASTVAHRRRWFKAAAVWAPPLLAAAAFLPAGLAAQAPDETWRTLTTEHFRVTFPAALETLGRRAGDRAERAYAELTRAFLPPPGGRIDLLVTDHTDLTNGFARVTPSNRITVYAEPPVDDPNLGYFDDWIDLVVTHELAHIFHLDRTGVLGRVLRGLFGRVPAPWPFFPELGVPRWTVEGLATWYESALTSAGRLHGTFQETMLRTAVLEGRFEDLDQASGESPVWPAGARAYAYGSHFFEYLLDRYGEDRMGAFAEAVAGQWVPYRLDAAAKRAFGTAISEEWAAWTDSLRARYEGVRDDLRRLGPLSRPDRLTPGSRLALHPLPSPDGEVVAWAQADGRTDAQIRLAAPDGSGARKLSRTNGIATFDWLADGALLVAQLERADPYRTYSDLYRVDADGRATRLTHGGRLMHPSVVPGAATAVAVQSGGGTTTLVEVDLAGGGARPIVPPDPDTHWAFPSVSPDGRWIAASRWRPGAYLDVVILDRAGRVVEEVTRDRAVDLRPRWSPDGRWLVWGSDRSGIQNILGAPVDPATGRAGTVRLLTNLVTGGAYPAVSPDGRWLYYSGYHVDGWEVERVPFSPGDAPAAPPPADRFDAPPRPDSVQHAAAAGAVQPYRPWRTLAPRFWEPLYRAPVRTPAVATRDLSLRSRRLLGAAFGAQTSGFDLVGRNAFGAFARFYTTGGKVDGGASWSWAGLGNPVLTLGAGQGWDEDGPRLGRRSEDAPLDTLFVLERARSVQATATVTRARVRSNAAASLAVGMVWVHRELLDNELNPSGFYRLTQPESRLGDVRVTLTFSTARGHAFQMGSSDGVSALLRLRSRADFDVPDSLAGRPGADRSLDEVLGRLQVYRSFAGPGFARHVVALRGAFGYARGPDADAGHFDVGGASGSAETVTGLSLFGGSSLFFPVRGYAENRRFGNVAWSATAEYRFPLALVHQGLGPWPFHVDRVFGSLFADAGNAWGPTLGAAGFDNPRRATLASAGAEVTAQVLTFWRVPMRLRTGAAWPLVEGAGGVVYARIGLSF